LFYKGTVNVISDLKARMGEALRLTNAGRLAEATALLQGLPQNVGSSEVSDRIKREAPWRAGAAVQLIDMVPPPSPSGHWTAPEIDTHDATPAAGITPPNMPGALQELLDRFGDRGSSRRSGGLAVDRSPEVRTPLPGGARFEEHTYANKAGSRSYKLFVPSRYCGEPLPLVVMLHGCKQSPDDFAAGTRMNELAEEQIFLVAYPAQSLSANSSGCWNWFNGKDQLRDKGEPSLIAGITRQIMDFFAVDPTRVFIAGLSAGGATAAIMGSAYPDLYAGICVHSGLACGVAQDLPSAFAAMRHGGSPPPATYPLLPTIVFHGDRDNTVSPLNGDQIIAQSKGDRKLRQTISHGQSAGGIGYTHTVHLDGNGSPVLEQWVLHGAGHAWSGGSPAGSYTAPRGPDASREMLRFFLTRSTGHFNKQTVPPRHA
jgi:poly(hydroxyalkanoate) depolymerase family esterase